MSKLLTDEQRDTFLEHMSLYSYENSLMWHCPGCLRWHDYVITVSRSLCAIQSYENASVDPKGPVVPLIQVICPDCGYTMFFNAAILAQTNPEIAESLGVLPKEVTSLVDVKEKKRVEEIKQELIRKGF